MKELLKKTLGFFVRLHYLLPAALLSSSFVLITNYGFLDPNRTVHLDTEYRQVGKAKFYSPDISKGSHQRYRDAHAYSYFSHYLNENNALSWKAGYSYIGFDWPQNPRFRGDNYNFANASLSWVSTAVKNWRWILGTAVSVDAQSFNFGNTGVYYGLMWGRYCYTETLGLHVGWYGYVGVKNGYMLPILGIDWQMANKWRVNAIFPVNLSLDYNFAPHWSVYLEGSAFGRPYRFPMRAHEGIDKYHNGIFEIYSKGIELNLKYFIQRRLSFIVGGGWNLGGWILIKDHANHHGRYFKFDGAPYAQGKFTLTF